MTSRSKSPSFHVLRLLWIAAAFLPIFGLSVSSISHSQAEEGPPPTVALRSPQLLTVLPMGARPGSVTEVELRGEFLDRAERIVFSSSDISAVVKKESFSSIQLEVRVSSEAEPGPRYFRVITPRGASNLLLFRISDWPSLLEREPNNQLTNLPMVDWPVLVSGLLGNPRDVDLFRFRAKAGQRLGLHVLAARNWSGADLSLALLDSAGRALQQDEGTFIWDPYIDFTCPKDGEYVAAVMLTRMPAGGQSGRDLVYQLAIGQVPLLRSVFPLYLRLGSPINLQIRGEFLDPECAWSVDGVSLKVQKGGSEVQNPPKALSVLNLIGQVAPEEAPGIHFLRPSDRSGLVVPLAVILGETPAAAESARNDDLHLAEPISLPVIINGKIEHNWDEDFYQFEANAGDALVFLVDAEKWGSRLDARLSLLDATGKTLATNDDAKVIGRPLNWDPHLEFTFKEKGTYFIKIYSLQRRGGDDYVYALRVRRQVPGFTLGLGAERLAVRRGDKARWNVTLQRDEGFKGEVKVDVSGLPAGVQAKPLVLKSDQITGAIELVADADAPLQTTVVEFLGRSMVEGKEYLRKATVPAARITGSGPGFKGYYSTEGWLSIVEPPLFSLESAVSEVFLVRGGRAEFGVKVVRSAKFTSDLDFNLENLPDGVRVENVEMVDEGRMARITLHASETAVVGRVPDVTIVAATGDVKRRESAPRVNIQVD